MVFVLYIMDVDDGDLESYESGLAFLFDTILLKLGPMWENYELKIKFAYLNIQSNVSVLPYETVHGVLLCL